MSQTWHKLQTSQSILKAQHMKMMLLLPENAMPSMGARYVSASLKSAGHQSVLLFLPKEFDDFENETGLRAKHCQNPLKKPK